MSSLSFLLLCVQACLVQNVFCQCLGAGPIGYGIAPGARLAPGLAPYGLGVGLGAAPFGVAPMAMEVGAYGGAGVGNVAVAGEMPVAGTSLVAGQVPNLGAVRFAGDVPAAGTVTIAGSGGCESNRGPY